MRILHLTSWYSAIGGQETYVHALCRALSRLGHSNVVVYGQQGGSPFPEAVPSHWVPDIDRFPGAGLENQWQRLLALLAVEKPDVVMAHGGANWALLDRLQKRIALLPFVHTFTPVCPGVKFFRTSQTACSLPLGPGCLASAYLRQCANRHPLRLWSAYRSTGSLLTYLQRVPRVLLASQHMGAVMQQNGLQKHQLVVNPYFTPLLRLPPTPYSATARLILFVGRIAESKGIQVLLRALCAVKPPWRLVVAGEGPYARQAQRVASRLGIQSAVSFLGWVSQGETLRLYQEAAVVVVPSLWAEPFGLVGLEAMACARPVVASAIGGTPEWLSDGETGLLVPPGDAGAMAAAIARLLAEPAAAETMGRQGRESAEEHFSEARHVATLLTELQRAVVTRAAAA